MKLAHPKLQKLTDNFIRKFFDKAYEIEQSEKDNPKPKRNDGYNFSYTLAKCIINSEHTHEQESEEYCLMGMGFVQNIIKGFFENSIQNFNKDIKFILKNFDKQEPYADYRFTDLKITTEPITVEDFKIKSVKGVFDFRKVNVTKTQKTYSFKASNNKSGYEGFCKVVFINNKLDRTNLFDSSGKKLQLTISAEKETLRLRPIKKPSDYLSVDICKPEIHHFKYVADINGFLNILTQVHYGIKET